jgi:regulator of sigma E protease
MEILQLLLCMLILNVLYHVGELFWALKWGIHHQHYFIGRGPKLFSFQVGQLQFTIGIYIPIIWLGKIYEYGSGEKKRACSAWEFSSFPIWKRLTVSLGGIASLFIAGIIIFTVLSYIEKESFIHKNEVNKFGIYPSELATEAGFQKGDKVLLIDGREYEKFTELLHPIAGTRYTIARHGKEEDILIDAHTAAKTSQYYEPFVAVWSPFVISGIHPGSVADYTGLQVSDQIKKVNHLDVISLEEYRNAIRADEDDLIDLLVYREGAEEEILFKEVALNSERTLGFFSEPQIEYTTKQNTLPTAIRKGFEQPFKVISSNVQGLYMIFSGSVTQSQAGGPITVAALFNDEYIWIRFWTIVAILASFTAFANLLPLPNTAFWYTVPLLYEATRKKTFPYESFRRIKRFGYYAVIALMVSTIVNDMVKLFS